MTPAEVAAHRKALGLTQEKMAAQLGVCRESVGRWEGGTRRITRVTELAIRALALAAVTRPTTKAA